jgi:hypothetical protein
MKTTVKLTPENASTLTWCSKLTGLPTEELINFFLAEYFENFNEDTTTACILIPSSHLVFRLAV